MSHQGWQLAQQQHRSQSTASPGKKLPCLIPSKNGRKSGANACSEQCPGRQTLPAILHGRGPKPVVSSYPCNSSTQGSGSHCTHVLSREQRIHCTSLCSLSLSLSITKKPLTPRPGHMVYLSAASLSHGRDREVSSEGIGTKTHLPSICHYRSKSLRQNSQGHVGIRMRQKGPEVTKITDNLSETTDQSSLRRNSQQEKLSETIDAEPRHQPEAMNVEPRHQPEAMNAEPRHQPEAMNAEPRHQPEAMNAEPRHQPEAMNAEPRHQPEAMNVEPRPEDSNLYKLPQAEATEPVPQQQRQSVVSAAEVSDFITVATLLHRGENPSEQNAHGWSALHYACCHGNRSAVQLLIESAADLDLSANDGSTPLHVAVLGCDLAVTELLLKAHANVDAQNVDGARAIHLAVMAGFNPMVQLLADTTGVSGASLDQLTASSVSPPSPLFVAAVLDRPEAAAALIQAGDDVNFCNSDCAAPFLTQLFQQHHVTDAERDLLSRCGVSAMEAAAVRGHVDLVTQLVTAMADPDHQDSCGFTPMHSSARRATGNLGREEFHKIFVSSLDWNTDEVEAEVKISIAGVVAVLISGQANADIEDQDGHLPMNRLLFAGVAEAVAMLIDAGANIDHKDGRGMSILHHACVLG